MVVKGQSRLCLTEQLGVEALEGGGFALAAALDVAVEIFLRPVRKNTTRPLTVWIVGANVERGIVFGNRVWYDLPRTNRQIGICRSYVDTSFQSEGIGDELIEFAIKELHANNLWASPPSESKTGRPPWPAG